MGVVMHVQSHLDSPKSREAARSAVSLGALLCALFAAVMVFLPASAFADTEPATSYAGGTGTASDPYQIANVAQLRYMMSEVNKPGELSGSTYTPTAAQTAHYALTADIDASGETAWSPIGWGEHTTIGEGGERVVDYAYFCGTFDGNGHSIKLKQIGITDLTLQCKMASLFGATAAGQQATFKDFDLSGTTTAAGVGQIAAGVLGVADGNVTFEGVTCSVATTASGSSGIAGGLVGKATGTLTIDGCETCGPVSGMKAAGGMVGYALDCDLSLHASRNYLDFNAASTNTGLIRAGSVGENAGNAGGLVGLCESESASTPPTVTISACGNTGSVSASAAGGGLVGANSGCKLTISNCFSAAENDFEYTVIGTPVGGTAYLGGIVGRTQGGLYRLAITNTYSASLMGKQSQADGSTSVGGMVGLAGVGEEGSEIRIGNCYFRGDAAAGWAGTRETDTGGLVAPTISQSNALPLSFDDLKRQGASKLGAYFSDGHESSTPNYGYPVLYWQLGHEEPSVNLEEATISSTEKPTYTGKAVLPSDIRVMLNGTELNPGSDYTVTGSNNVNVTTETSPATFTVVGAGAYAGTQNGPHEFDIDPANLGTSNCTYTATSTWNFGGNNLVRPTITITNAAGTQLQENVDYTLDWTSAAITAPLGRVDAVAVTGGNYSGSMQVQFAVAAGPDSFANASTGTENDPYIIDSVGALAYMQYCIENDFPTYGSAHYKLTADLDLVNTDTSPLVPSIGIASPFAGSFDGGGHTITMHAGTTQPLFNAISGSHEQTEVKDLVLAGTMSRPALAESVNGGETTFYNVSSSVAVSASAADLGGLVGIMKEGSLTFNSCITSGSVTDGLEAEGVGGMLGRALPNAHVVFQDCANTGNIQAPNATRVGGLLGFAGSANGESCASSSEFLTSYNSGNITARGMAGGLEGCGYNVRVESAYNTGYVTVSGLAADGPYAGGLVGWATRQLTVKRAYNTGLVTYNGVDLTGTAAGAICGDVANGNASFSNTHYLELSCTQAAGRLAGDGITKQTSEVMQSVDFADTTLGTPFHFDSNNVNGHFPVFITNVVDLTTETDVIINVVSPQAYTGKAVTPNPSVIVKGVTLRKDVDYTLQYVNNINPGTATVYVIATGHYYKGSRLAAFQIVDSSGTSKQSMYRLYNPNSGEHFYTASTSERDNLRKVGWRYEGIGWTAPATSNTPVYRLYNPNGGDHHYTMSAEERDWLRGLGWKYEGIGWYSDDNKTTPLYRLYNPNAKSGSHHYTTSASERDGLRKLGWHYEGIGWYGL